MKRKPTDVYLRAAEFVEFQREYSPDSYSCNAIDHVSRRHYCASRSEYNELFKPEDCRTNSWGDYWHTNPEKRQQIRVLALLFMHWISQGDTAEGGR